MRMVSIFVEWHLLTPLVYSIQDMVALLFCNRLSISFLNTIISTWVIMPVLRMGLVLSKQYITIRLSA